MSCEREKKNKKCFTAANFAYELIAISVMFSAAKRLIQKYAETETKKNKK
jgi:hypothetical protein